MSDFKPTRFPNGIQAPILNDDGEQAAAITDADGTNDEVTINEILAALRGAGIVAEE